MPFFQAMAKKANAALTKEALADLPADTFAEPGTLVESLAQVGIIGGPHEDDERAYLDAFPSGLKESVRAVLHDNLNAPGGPLDITVAWSPGYDDEVSLFQSATTDRSEGGITILVKSRYPSDRTGPTGTGIVQP